MNEINNQTIERDGVNDYSDTLFANCTFVGSQCISDIKGNRFKDCKFQELELRPWFNAPAQTFENAFEGCEIESLYIAPRKQEVEQIKSAFAQCEINSGSLSLADLDLEELPSFVCDLEWVEVLNIRKNKFKTLPPEIGRLSNLTWLNVGDCFSLESLPQEMAEMTSLEKLFISNNSFSTLPAVVCKITSLRVVNLSCNENLHELPEELSNLELLEELNVSLMSWFSLPKVIFELKGLRELDASNTKLQELPSEISQLTSLETLNLNNCGLTQLPKAFNELQALKCLSLSDNRLGKKETGQLAEDRYASNLSKNSSFSEYHDKMNQQFGFDSGSSKEIIEAAEARKEIEEKALALPIESLTQLEQLDLSSNEGVVLPSDLSQMKALKKVSLNYDAYTEEGCEGLKTAPSLEELNAFSCGSIREVPAWFFEAPALKEAYLATSGISSDDETAKKQIATLAEKGIKVRI